MTLKELRLTNIVLVETISIPFSNGFNVLSGESGSGKSAIINALNLIQGDRSDPSVIRRGADKGIVEAVFDINNLRQVEHLLDEAGIDHQHGDELYIRREITTAGKSRAFINNQLAQLALLRQITGYLFEIVGQHANQKLLSTDYHRQVVDLYGKLENDVSAFAHSLEEELQTRQSLESLVQSESQRIRQIEILTTEIEEIEQANLKDGEEEELFSEYTLLSNAEELMEKTSDILRVLSGEKIGALPHLNRLRGTFDQLIRLAPNLAETAASFENARLELEEVSHCIQRYESRIEHNPEKAGTINSRLEVINKLKKKYGPTIEEVQSYLANATKKLTSLQNADADIEMLQEKLKSDSERTNALAAKLSQKRATVAAQLQTAAMKQLRSLNMPKAEFFIEITPQKRTRHGDDKIEFYLTPNVGEHRISLKDCASGGELSRTLLTIQTLLAGKDKIPTLIFDEVDANIGGETASIVGEKLKDIAKKHQVLCITHFHQVARQAEYHLRIYKQEISGRTVTLVDTLDKDGQHLELERMLGRNTIK